MAQPVWVLSVDLQTKTATFQSGMADAAKAARGAFTDIKSGSGDMGRAVATNMFEARHGVMLLGEEFGIRLPRALTAFITSIGPVGAAMEAAFPFLAIAVGATLLLQHLASLHEAGQKLTLDQVNFGTEAQNAFNSLNEKLLQVGIRADELRNDHLGALKKQLELIDMQSMAELEKTFGILAKSADVVFADLKTSWYNFSAGSAGAKHSLEEFHGAYAALLSQGDDKGASKLLEDKIARESRLLDMQNQVRSAKGQMGTGSDEAWAKNLQYGRAMQELKAVGLGTTDKEVEAQKKLVEVLHDQEVAQGKIAQLRRMDQDNAKLGAAKEGAGTSSAAAKAAAESKQRIAEQDLAAQRAVANAALTIQRASAEEREIVEVAFADRELQIRLQSNTAQIAALDKMAKDYPNQLKALHEKAEEAEAQHAAVIAEINSKSLVAQAAETLQRTEQSEREKIEATDKGTSARLAALDAAIREESALNLQETSNYRELLTQRVETTRLMAAEEHKLQAEAAKEAAEQTLKTGQLALAAELEQRAVANSARRVSIQMQMQQQIDAANKKYALQLTAGAQEMAGLDKTEKDYENKLRALQDIQKQLVQEHENEITAIKDKAEIERNQKILGEETKFHDVIAAGLTQTIMGHKSFASMMNSIGNQVVSGLIQNAIQSILANDMTKESDAAAAARKAFNAGMKFPWPANLVLAPALGAVAFASVMAFEGGTDRVPGVGRGDTVPAMLTPGEGVVPGGVMDGLRNLVKAGGMATGQTVHVTAHYAPQVQAMDSDGVHNVLDKHGDVFQQHVESAVRKLNR